MGFGNSTVWCAGSRPVCVTGKYSSTAARSAEEAAVFVGSRVVVETPWGNPARSALRASAVSFSSDSASVPNRKRSPPEAVAAPAGVALLGSAATSTAALNASNPAPTLTAQWCPVRAPQLAKSCQQESGEFGMRHSPNGSEKFTSSHSHDASFPLTNLRSCYGC